MYSLGPGGLSPTKGKELKLAPGVRAWLGASSSPDEILIIKVDSSTITFRKYPYTKDQRIERAIGEDLIHRGTTNWLRSYGSHWPEASKRAKDLLAGKKTKTVNVSKFLKEQERVQVLVRPKKDVDWSKTRSQDPWYAAEQYGGVGGLDSKDSPTGMDYEISTNRGVLDNEIKKDKRFEVVKVTKRSASVTAGYVSAWDHRRSEIIALRSAELQNGKTWETDNVRIHRFRTSYHAWDLTNAGKRGKTVEKISLYDLDMVKDPTVKSNLEKLAKGVDKVKDFGQVVKWFNMIVKDAKQRDSLSPKIEERAERGIDVAPAGFKPIRVTGKGVQIDADYNSFRVRNLVDKYNEPTCIPAIKGGKKWIKVFYRWVKDNEAKIKTMDFPQVLKEMKKQRIQFHQYCAMD